MCVGACSFTTAITTWRGVPAQGRAALTHLLGGNSAPGNHPGVRGYSSWLRFRLGQPGAWLVPAVERRTFVGPETVTTPITRTLLDPPS
jgi:hypothetical protein